MSHHERFPANHMPLPAEDPLSLCVHYLLVIYDMKCKPLQGKMPVDIGCCCLCAAAVRSNKKMSELDESSENEAEAQIGGGRASIDSVNEFLKEFKSARMSFEPLDTWLFVKPNDGSSNDIDSALDSNDVSNDVSATNESDSSIVYHFDSDEVSSCDSDDDGDYDDYNATETAIISCGAASVYTVNDCGKECDEENTLIVRNLASSPGRSGCGVKVFSEADQSDQSDIFEDTDCTSADVSSDYNSDVKRSVELVEKCITDSHNIYSVNQQSTVCSYNTHELCSDRAPVSTNHDNVTYRSSKCYRNIYSDCDILDKFDSASEKPSEFAVDASSVSHRRQTNQNTLTIDESSARTEREDSVANCSCTDASTGAEDTLKRRKKRQRIAQELLDTEATYQRHLELIIQV